MFPLCSLTGDVRERAVRADVALVPGESRLAPAPPRLRVAPGGGGAQAVAGAL